MEQQHCSCHDQDTKQKKEKLLRSYSKIIQELSKTITFNPTSWSSPHIPTLPPFKPLGHVYLNYNCWTPYLKFILSKYYLASPFTCFKIYFMLLTASWRKVHVSITIWLRKCKGTDILDDLQAKRLRVAHLQEIFQKMWGPLVADDELLISSFFCWLVLEYSGQEPRKMWYT